MKRKINNQKIILATLTILFLAASFEIIVYFFYIYKPANQIFSSKKTFLLEIPALSELLKPSQITNSDISLADTPKSFYTANLLSFKNSIEEKIAKDNTFIKDANISYILEGTITNLVKSSDGSINITLSNSTGALFNLTFTESELSKTKTRLIILSLTSPTRTEIQLEDAIPGDRFVIKSSQNLLTNSPDVKDEIEIFRVPKP